MNILTLLHQSKLALNKESEIELAYLFRGNIKNIDFIKLEKPWYSGFFFQIIAFFGKMLTNLSFLAKR